MKRSTLWTKDFTIITLGSVVSMLGNSLSGFAMSLLVLDFTKSTLLFAVYNVLYFLPSVLVPALCGPFLDRFSRKKTIYALDFFSAGLFALFAAVMATGWFSFGAFAAVTVLIGTVNSVYNVAFESFYPLLVSKGNFQKAYSIGGTLETLTMFMVPLSALIYRSFGIVPLFAADSVTFFIAAVMETRIKADEKYLEKRAPRKKGIVRTLASDFSEGMRYLWAEKGLLAIAAYFTVSAFAGGVSETVSLPWFVDNLPDGELTFSVVWGMSSLARAIGGGFHYVKKIDAKKKFAIALFVYVATCVLEGTYLYCPVWAMMIMCFATGILGVTSYTIRISATQNYVPDEKKGRFNGAFNTLNTAGTILGTLLAGVLAEFADKRIILSAVMALCAVAAAVFIGGNKKHVARIYNTDN